MCIARICKWIFKTKKSSDESMHHIHPSPQSSPEPEQTHTRQPTMEEILERRAREIRESIHDPNAFNK